jgi:hypothetical protein
LVIVFSFVFFFWSLYCLLSFSFGHCIVFCLFLLVIVVFSISLCVLLVIVLSVLLRLTGPDYTFGISKHFFLYVGMKKI